MRIDVHCHAIGNGINPNDENDVFFYPDDNQLFFTRFLYNMVESKLGKLEADQDRDGKISTKEYFDYIYEALASSDEIDAIVLLAMDALYSPRNGILDELRTDLWVKNKFLFNKITEMNKAFKNESDPKRKNKKFLFGASISPNNPNWKEEMDFIISSDATLLKLIPSTQHIYLMDTKHKEFYETLKENGIPLLCHVGPEYSFPEGLKNKQLDNFRYLELALECGVKVIAAHCASPVFPLIDPNEMKEFYAFMKKYNSGSEIKIWTDTSALSLSTRLPIIPQILSLFPSEWMVHGTDFPIPIDSWPHLPFITHDVSIKEYFKMMKTKNPFDLDILIKKAHGFSDSILYNAKNVLKLESH